MKLRPFLLGLALCGSAAGVLAQDTPQAEAGAEAALAGPLARLPTNLFGIDCRVSPIGDDAVTAICLPRDFMRGPIAGVTTAAVGRDLSYEELVEQMRESFHESGNLRVIEEEPFEIASAPGATSMRAIYQTGMGRKFTWSASYQGNLTRVIITVTDNAKRKTFEDEVMAKVFGPDRYVPAASAES